LVVLENEPGGQKGHAAADLYVPARQDETHCDGGVLVMVAAPSWRAEIAEEFRA
jgi:hypothetical protein